MANRVNTSPSLLNRLRDRRDQEAWSLFVDLYGPLIYAYGRRMGLQDADAADLTQAVFGGVVRGIGAYEYDPSRARFRTWLFRLVHDRYCRMFAHRWRGPREQNGLKAEALLRDCPAPGGCDEAAWQQEYDRGRFRWAAAKVRGLVAESHWQAFWRTTVERQEAAKVADDLGLSLGALYTAKSRVLDRIRSVIRELDDE
ncbi:MAG: sigma factor [Isosphaeraceae bacterium]